MFSVQLFEMPLLSSDCWLTLTFGLRSDNDDRKANNQHNLTKKRLPKKLCISHKAIGLDIKALLTS